MFTTSDVHHLRRSPPPLWNQTFTTPDIHHPRRSPPQTFTTPFVKSDVHHPRHSPPPILKCNTHHQPTFTTNQHSPPTNIHHPLQSSPPKEKFTNLAPCTRAEECSPSSGWWYLKQSNMESNENTCAHYCNLIIIIGNKQTKELTIVLVNSPRCIILICNLTHILCSLPYVLTSQTHKCGGLRLSC